MQNEPLVLQSLATCLDRDGGSVLRTGLVSHLLKPVLNDSLHVIVGAGCGDWGMCLYLTIADAAKLNADLGQLLADHAARG